MLLTIAANCVVLIFATPTSTNDDPDLNNRLVSNAFHFVKVLPVYAFKKIEA